MKRIDIVFDMILKLDKGAGVSTISISNESGISRANVSSQLNRLCKIGKVEKISDTRPVLYKVIEVSREPYTKQNILDIFRKDNISMYNCIEQAKAAVLYPPNGMNMLILGETGVGKSMFANIIHKYSIEVKRLKEDAPFVVFNCADYTNNKELLLSQLFGVKKGSFTGALTDKPGLIEEANNGILFLDEVHRLPSEGQEMLFTFLDRGVFRRLGETTNEREARVLIILATTENPNNVLLKAFTRRIPMVINIPSLKDRTIEERFKLLETFFKHESKMLNMPIKVTINVLRSFLSYDCKHNIGQLKVDTKLTCARAYADSISQNKNEITISSCDILQHIREGLYKEVEHRDVWNKLIDATKRYCVFNYESQNVLFEEKAQEISVYDLIEIKRNELINQGLNDKYINLKISKEIDNYFAKYFRTNYAEKKLKLLENLVGKNIIDTVYEIEKYVEVKLNRLISNKTFIALCIHIDKAVKRIKENKAILNPKLSEIERRFNLEFNVSLECLKIIEKNFDIEVPLDEAGFLAIILSHEIEEKDISNCENQNVIVIVIAHGEHTATSMVKVANTLLETNSCIGINAPLNKKPEEVLQKLSLVVKNKNSKKGILLLVDMGSLVNFGEEIEKEFNINVKTVPLVSTLHVLEATRKADRGISLNKIYEDIINVSYTMNFNYMKPINTIPKYKIITICSTGIGGSKVILNILNSKLKYDKNLFEIIPISFKSEPQVLNKLKEFDNIVFMVSYFNFQHNKKIFNIEELINGERIKNMQEIIDIETTYSKIGKTLKEHIKNIETIKAVENVKVFLNSIIKKLNIEIETKHLIGIVFHMVCMLDRLVINQSNIIYPNKYEYIKKNPLVYKVIQDEIKILNNTYSVSIKLDEICYLIKFINTKAYL